MKEQVEIVMATYNGEKYIKEQLDSLLSQSHPYLLVDVCDDGSTDDTVSIVKDYEKKDSRVRLFENKTNQGYIRNFMSGIVRCDSPYIMLCDQDDIWNWDKVELTLEKMKLMERENPEKPVLVFTDAMNFDSSTGKKLGMTEQSLVPSKLQKEVSMMNGNTAKRRAAHKEIVRNTKDQVQTL